ncbi:hypothetical protein [Streptomyces sp. MS2.AVA.5]|uniref:Uncharacterized protein n=1 Tax=Streptomyces achmelvichensis TaxID=3134111 RepID=A0ACC6PKS5_9ACTN
MSPHLADATETDGELIGRCYTKARRTPLVVGSVPGGAGRSLRLPGGPYTLTQLAAIVGAFIGLLLTRPVWGGHGLVDVMALIGCPFAAAFVLRRLHIDGRNPAAAAVSVATMLTGPRWGRLHGRPVRPARPVGGATLITVTAEANPAGAATAQPAAPGTTRSPRPITSASHRPTPPASAPEAAAAGGPVASGVQTLLARHVSSAQSDLEN